MRASLFDLRRRERVFCLWCWKVKRLHRDRTCTGCGHKVKSISWRYS